jgi:hypothetical protein
MTSVASEYLLISEAVERLEAGMWGGRTRPQVVIDAKKHYPRASIGFERRKKMAGEAIYEAMKSHKLPVYVFPGTEEALPILEPIAVPVELLVLMPKVRKSLPDRLVRHPFNLFRNHSMAPDLFAALSTSSLLLRKTDFDAWYKKQRARRLWKSQISSRKPRIGRPSKQTEELLTSIKALVAQGRWTAADGIAKLAELLAGATELPKRDTLRRAIDRLFDDTGDLNYRLIPRHRSPKSTR